MIAVGPRAQIEDRGDRTEIEFAVEMRKQFVVARGLPAQGIAQRVGVHRNQKQAGLAEEVFSRGLGDLRRRREMDEAVAYVVLAAPKDALPLGLAPGRGGADFVDRAHVPAFPACR